MTYPKKVRIVEVGARDGLQNEKSLLSVDLRTELIDKLSETGLSTIEVGAFVSPKWVPQMADSGQVLENIKKKQSISYPVLVPNLKGMELAIESGAKEIAVFAAASESFSQKNINCTIQESLERFAPVCEMAESNNIKIRGYVSCVLGCPYEGDISPDKVKQVTESLFDLGCYEVSLGDTIGVGTPIKTQQLLHMLKQSMDVSKLAVHFHDTYGQALANILIALQEGVTVIDSSVSGLGGCPYAKGASGNVATEDVVYMLNGMHIESNINLDALIKISHWISGRLDRTVGSKVSCALSEG